MDSITKPVLCGFCGKEFDYTVYPMIHIPGDHGCKASSGACEYTSPGYCNPSTLWKHCRETFGWRGICGECEESGEGGF